MSISVKSIEEEYEYIKAQKCKCGGDYKIQHVDLVPGPGDEISVECLLCGNGKEFIFDISSFLSLGTVENSAHMLKHSLFSKSEKGYRGPVIISSTSPTSPISSRIYFDHNRNASSEKSKSSPSTDYQKKNASIKNGFFQKMFNKLRKTK
jgi:hypothetical protein